MIELEHFTSKPELQVRRIVSSFAAAIQNRLSDDPAFVTLDHRRLDRSTLTVSQSFDDLPTIFTFCLRHPVRGDLLTPAETLAVYQALRSGLPRVQLGQPVASGADISALRLCLSAPLICQACASDAALDALISQAMAALDQVITVVSNITRTHETKRLAG
jgi:hypothetical protein